MGILRDDRLDAGCFTMDNCLGRRAPGYWSWLSFRAAECGDIGHTAARATDRGRWAIQSLPQRRVERRHLGGERSADAQHTDQSCRDRGACYGGEPGVREPNGYTVL